MPKKKDTILEQFENSKSYEAFFSKIFCTNYINFDTDFFIDFFLDRKNIDLLSRFTNAILYDMNYELITDISKIYSLPSEPPYTDFDIPIIFLDANTENGDSKQIVICPCNKQITSSFADKLCTNIYREFYDLSPTPPVKRSLHFIFLLNRKYLDSRDSYGCLNNHFHIINTPKTTCLPLIFNKGDLILHFIQLPLFFKSNLKDVEMDLIILISIFILTSVPEAIEFYEFFNKIDPSVHRIWEAFGQYKSGK